MTEASQSPGSPGAFVPALGVHWLTRFYDPVIRATLREDRLRALLVAQAGPKPGDHILDIGCGTGSLTVMIKQACPEARVVGLDADPKVLERASAKARGQGVVVELREGSADQPPFDSGSFDLVVSSLMFHHLLPQVKLRAFREAFELLRPGGRIHVADWGRPGGRLMRAAFLLVQFLDGFATTADHVQGLLPRYMEEAGFRCVAETHREATVLGTLSLYRAHKPSA